MSNAIVFSRGRLGIDAPLIQIEVHLSKGLPGFSMVGLPETAVKESRDRVRSAILNTGFEMPVKKIIVNLAPADLPKEGARFDLAIAMGILAASKQIPIDDLSPYEFAGELGLNGDIRPITGLLPFAVATRKAARTLITANERANEAAFARCNTWTAEHLSQVTAHFCGVECLPVLSIETEPAHTHDTVDLADIHGQAIAKRALIVAASGGHSLLMQGPPGTGKSMLAQRLTTLLPPLSEDRAMEVATIHSISKIGFDVRTWKQPPFRAPHHTASAVALVGGGSHPAPGEISLAHHGVLFLDELPEFSRKVIEVMREPLESRKVNISRAQQSLTFPAHFQLICAMNPCPCGYLTDPSRECRCTPPQIEQYQHKISGPLLDRIDMHLEIPRVPLKDMVSQQKSEMTSEEARVQVDKARVIQFERQGKLNTEINPHREKIAITADAQDKCLTIVEKFSLSARSYYRIIKLARTLADLEASQLIEVPHIQEAFNLRKLDRVFKA